MVLRLYGFCLRQLGWASTRRNIHPLTSIMVINRPLSASSINTIHGILPHIHLTILISACWSANSFSFLTGQVSFPCNILLRTQPPYNLPLTFNDICLLVSNGTNDLNLFHPIRILFSTAASASPCNSACHLNNKTYPLTPDSHWHEYLHLWKSFLSTLSSLFS